uniref:Uncharacterized protein n=1 Tax=Timema cristinae TaxID=61476 RepID=A0A7R9H3F8_TIMCR|nr:unnamed protein product [Timema cristinae]
MGNHLGVNNTCTPGQESNSELQVLLISLTLLAVAAMITGAQIDFMRHINQNNTQTNNLRKERSISSNLPAYMLPYMLDEQVEADYGDELFSSLDKRGRETTVDFRPLCETTTKTVHLHDGEHEYQPAHYMETHCKTYNTQKAGSGAVVSSNQWAVLPLKLWWGCLWVAKKQRWGSEASEGVILDSRDF